MYFLYVPLKIKNKNKRKEHSRNGLNYFWKLLFLIFILLSNFVSVANIMYIDEHKVIFCNLSGEKGI